MPISVLICDDSNLARKQMARSIPPGWDVTLHYAGNGQEGIAAIKEGKGDILFLDLNMPVMDGYQVMETIHNEDLPTMVIVVSGDIQPEAYKKVKALGAIDFIKKPTDKEKLAELLLSYGIITENELQAAEPQAVSITPSPVSIPQSSETTDSSQGPTSRELDSYREVANVAMGQAADLLARVLNCFIHLPIPTVNLLEVSELHMALKAAEETDTISAVCQGFTSAGVAGEALLLFHDSSFTDMAKLMHYNGEMNKGAELELLMDTANILIGAFLSGLARQLDIHFGQGQPVVLGRHCNISELIEQNTPRWQRTLAIEINYQVTEHQIQCDLLLLITEDSLPTLNSKLNYMMEHYE